MNNIWDGMKPKKPPKISVHASFSAETVPIVESLYSEAHERAPKPPKVQNRAHRVPSAAMAPNPSKKPPGLNESLKNQNISEINPFL